MQKPILVFLLLFLNFLTLAHLLGQEVPAVYKLHSHNDYLQAVPFWEAFANEVESIEADIICFDDELYVAHEKESIIKDRTLVSLYLDPIKKAFELNLGRMKEFQLLIDIKTEPYSTLKKLGEVLSAYEDILIGEGGSSKVQIVISGNRPEPDEYLGYPDYIQFDYQSIADTADLPLDKIAMISLNFRKLSAWQGTGQLDSGEEEKILEAIKVARSLHKPIRFWATPDNDRAWNKLMELGVDYINTDRPWEARTFIRIQEKERP